MNKIIYYSRKLGNEIILAKIENLSGYKYKDGEWISYPYVCRELFEDACFDIITKEETIKLKKKIDNGNV